jgi:hypothetical protein
VIKNCAIATGSPHGRGPGARAARPLELLLVGGMLVVDGGELS